MFVRRAPALLISLGLVACGGEDVEPMQQMPMGNTNNNAANNNNGTNNNNTNNNNEPMEPAGLAVLGNYSHSLANVKLEWVSSGADPLDDPKDLAINPLDPSQVWVVNRGDNSITVFTEMGTETQVSTRYNSFGSDHFLVKPISIAFGDNGNFATIHEEDDFTQGPPPRGTPADFMGPTLWPSRLDVFDGGHSSHLDMLHNSPNGMGIAWERDNAYWVFDGYHSSITRYDFNEDHGYGGSDHSDGIIFRYLEGEVSRVEDVPSHMVFDNRTNMLYIADTGNNRIIAFDTQSGERGQRLFPNYDGVVQFNMTGGQYTVFVDGAEFGLQQPSGLAMHDDVLYVGDAATGFIHAFDMMGEQLDWLPMSLPAGALSGIEVGADGAIWGVDNVSERLFKVTALPAE